MFLCTFLLVCLFLTEFFHPITAINEDLGRHLLLGGIISKSFHVPKTNLLSYTYTDFPFINSSWLSEVIFYTLTRIGGFNLLIAVNTIIIAFALGIEIAYAIKKYSFSLTTLTAVSLYILLLSSRSDVRPEIFSMLFISLFIVILYSCRENVCKKIFILIPLEIVWVNMHIYFFIGPILIALFLIDDLTTNNFKFREFTKIASYALFGTVVATTVNPNNIHGAIFPLSILRNYGLPVVENQSILTLYNTYHSPEILFPLFAIAALYLVLFMGRKNAKPIEWLLATFFSLSTFFIFRNILLFVFGTFLSFTSQANFLSNQYNMKLKQLPSQPFLLNYPLSLLIIAMLIIKFISINSVGFGVIDHGKNAVDFLTKNKIKGPFYNNFDIGGYLSYRIYPQLVYVDNRPEAYPKSFFQQIYIPIQNNPHIFEKIDAEYRFNALVIEHWDSTPWGNRLLTYLVNNSHFKLIYLDSYVLILLRNTPTNKTLITRYLITKDNLRPDTFQNIQVLIHSLFFFEKVGWTVQAKEALIQLKLFDPQLCMLRQYPINKTSIRNFLLDNNKLQRNCSDSLVHLGI